MNTESSTLPHPRSLVAVYEINGCEVLRVAHHGIEAAKHYLLHRWRGSPKVTVKLHNRSDVWWGNDDDKLYATMRLTRTGESRTVDLQILANKPSQQV